MQAIALLLPTQIVRRPPLRRSYLHCGEERAVNRRCGVGIVGGVAGPVLGVTRTSVVVPVAEVVPGDVVRDQGVFRRVVGVAPLVAQGSLSLSMEPMEGYPSAVDVPLSASVSVWRVPGAA